MESSLNVIFLVQPVAVSAREVVEPPEQFEGRGRPI
jgi:hypothetical protein